MLMIFDRNANLRYKLGNRYLGMEEYYVSTVGLNEAIMKNVYLESRMMRYRAR